ncbi:MAG: hypothetical protein AUG51_26640 [Acidobacteria bacterium 13_1_20CM_3_53_8]|nr:MAG: hypothetical protein AUG51_26640 [Acidobacteria bacterium 13_1_20CM_3_53_8]
MKSEFANILTFDDVRLNDKLPRGGKPISITLSLPEFYIERAIHLFNLTRSLYEISPHIIEV